MYLKYKIHPDRQLLFFQQWKISLPYMFAMSYSTLLRAYIPRSGSVRRLLGWLLLLIN